MHPRRTIAAFVLACCWAAAACAQIKIGAEYDHDTPIVAECGQPPLLGGEAEYRWLIDGDEAGLIPVDNGESVHIWRAAGEHTLTLDVTYTISIVQPDPSAPDDRTKDKPVKLTLPAYHYAAVFRVLPDGGPAPTPQSLAELAGADAKDIGAVLAALAAQVSADPSLTVAQAQAAATSLLSRWPSNKAVPVIAKRLAVDTLPKFVAALEAAAKELGTEPGPPVIEGKRLVVIVRESASDTPQQAGAYTALRTGAAAAYMKSKGHTLTLLDPNDVDGTGAPAKLVAELSSQFSGQQLPLVFILDPQTHAVITRQPWPGSAQGVLDLLKAGGG